MGVAQGPRSVSEHKEPHVCANSVSSRGSQVGIRTTPVVLVSHCPTFSPASVADADQAPSAEPRAHCGHSPAKYSVLHCLPVVRPGSWLCLSP